MLFFILMQISCKKEGTESTAGTSEEKETSVEIDSNYQVNEALDKGEKLQVKSVIQFDAKHSTPKVWQYDLNRKQAALRIVHELTNGNILYLIEEGDGKYNFSPFVLILDKDGSEIAKHKIAVNSKSKYNFYSPLVAADQQGGFTLFAKKEITAVNEPAALTDEARMRNTLSKYQIDKLNFDSKYASYKTESKSMAGILLRPLQENGFSYIASADFSLKYIKGKIFISGTAAKPNQGEIPFIAVLDNNLKLLKMNSFEAYPQTKIENISLNKEGKFFVEGTQNDAADGTYYATYKRFVLNDDLKLIADQSDKEPYESVYRGPSAPDVDDEEESTAEDTAPESAQTESSSEPKENEKGSAAVFYTDRLQNAYYGIREKEMNSSEVVFEKSNLSDSTAVWKTKLVFPKNYEVPYNNSTTGFKRSNGDFVFFLYLRNENVENGELSAAIFVFNKEGRLTRQFQTPGYFGLTEFEMIESDGKLITAFVSNDAKYVNGEWEYPHAFRSIAFPLE